MATASNNRTAATIHTVLRVRLFIKARQKYPITPGVEAWPGVCHGLKKPQGHPRSQERPCLFF